MARIQLLKAPDYHMHTPRCNHAVGTIQEYAQAACDVGITEIGISDHSPMPNGFDKVWRMDESELSSFLEELEQAKSKFRGRLTIRSALEVDYYPGAEDHIKHLSKLYDWDYFMGSVHFIGSWGFDNPDELEKWESSDVDQVYCDYFRLVEQSARSGLFDIIGHPDLVKKFGHRASEKSATVEEAEDLMLQAVKEADIALEISSAGLRKPVAEIYPHERIVKKAAELHIPFTYGSDAHSPSEVGHGMDECLSLLKQYGITKIASFNKRERSMLSFIN